VNVKGEIFTGNQGNRLKRERQSRSHTHPPTYNSSSPGTRESAMLNGGGL
jgi:hypothetical protein